MKFLGLVSWTDFQPVHSGDVGTEEVSTALMIKNGVTKQLTLLSTSSVPGPVLGILPIH
jgi:hypothetical protein